MEFDEKIALLQQLTMRAYIFHQIWWIYEGVDTKPKFDAAYHDFSEFLRFDCHAQWVSMIMYLSLLFEARRDTVNLRALIQEAATAGVPAAQIDTATQILKQADHLAKKVAILRSNLFAHRSAELSYEDAFRKAEITPNQLRELAEASLRALNVISKARGGPEPSFSHLTREHTLRMLDKLAPTSDGGR
jgi:hypothetical protein